MTKRLFIVTAVLEAPAGLALLVLPSVPVSLLFGASLDGVAGLIITRICGASLVSLGLACWLVRGDCESRPARGLIAAMLFYNTAATALLVYSGIGLELSGVGLWPAALLHGMLVVWCAAALFKKKMFV